MKNKITLMRRRLLLSLGAAGLLAACTKRQPHAIPTVSDRELAQISLVAGDQSSLVHAKVDAAKAMDGAPYHIEWVNFQAPGPLLESLISDIDICVVGDMPALAAASAGIRFKILGAAESPAHGTAIIVPKDSPFHSMADLKGRTVTVSSTRGGVAHYLVLGALHEAGMKPYDIRLRYMLPGDAADAFDEGKLEAWATYGVFEAKAELQGARVIRDGADINTGLNLVLASERSLAIPARRVALKDFVNRLGRANDWTRENPNDYVNVLRRQTGMPEMLTRLLVERSQPREVPLDAHFTAQLQKIADMFFQSGVFPKRVRVAKLLEK